MSGSQQAGSTDRRRIDGESAGAKGFLRWSKEVPDTYPAREGGRIAIAIIRSEAGTVNRYLVTAFRRRAEGRDVSIHPFAERLR